MDRDIGVQAKASWNCKNLLFRRPGLLHLVSSSKRGHVYVLLQAHNQRYLPLGPMPAISTTHDSDRRHIPHTCLPRSDIGIHPEPILYWLEQPVPVAASEQSVDAQQSTAVIPVVIEPAKEAFPGRYRFHGWSER